MSVAIATASSRNRIRKDIRIRMIERDVTIASIARTAGVTPQSIRLALHGELKSEHILTAIADALGWPAERIWEN